MSEQYREAAPTYAWITGRSLGVDANVVGQTIEAIERRDGACHPAAFVEEVTPVSHPCHRLLEWDDEKAAATHRVNQARRVIRSIRLVRFPIEQTPAFISVRLPDQGATSYVSAERVINNANYREFSLDEAVRQLGGIRRRYGYLSELENVWRAIDDAEKDRAD